MNKKINNKGLYAEEQKEKVHEIVHYILYDKTGRIENCHPIPPNEIVAP